ncbi:dTDP-4-dehydrorhamnose 3,5-epimerase [Reichenbachiella sp. 5M10]|uniref:dTDP-4-dehydrorhamnose 3,5-epimerase n=1 Tax=Reichenbachiella sp. 5M10 TaxID=1889772 RepID=UPI000C16075D|nr:dTDP-4-dehydrorhamnose 3,5-epimerase [Reichenbachiella sp. 5M10]PIB37122.1 dTDP-4-dehydrorhamnose 3,5-epimerase [Reichenbachiella sp. 5M10]
MEIKSLHLKGAFSVQPKLFQDNRGYFFEWFNAKRFEQETGIGFVPVQFNSSRSTKGVLRGMHFQEMPASQTKLVGVTQGEIQDVIVDLREGSPTYGQYYSEVISQEKKNQLFVPKGFAHGFLVLSETAEIFYAIDDYYSPEHESGIMYNDAAVGIEWLLPENEIILSEKDKLYEPLTNRTLNFQYNG